MTEDERRLLIEQGRLLERIGIALELVQSINDRVQCGYSVNESGDINAKSVADMVNGIEDDLVRLLHHLERTSVEFDG